MSRRSRSSGRPKYIRKIIKQRGIRDVFHFTRYDNIAGIMEHGLLSVDELGRQGLSYIPSDVERRDGHRQAVCASISFPNWRMFYSKRVNSEAPQRWIVLSLNPSVLWKHRVDFYTYNAASEGMQGLDPSLHRRSPAFRALFEGENRVTEEGLPLPRRYPTENQAEVLIYDRIAPANIQYCVVGTGEVQQDAEKRYPNMQFYLSPLWPNGDAKRPGVYSQLDYFLRYGGAVHG